MKTGSGSQTSLEAGSWKLGVEAKLFLASNWFLPFYFGTLSEKLKKYDEWCTTGTFSESVITHPSWLSAKQDKSPYFIMDNENRRKEEVRFYENEKQNLITGFLMRTKENF